MTDKKKPTRNLEYDKEYRHEHKKEDAGRHRARRLMIHRYADKNGLWIKQAERKLRGDDVDHVDHDKQNNCPSNLRITTAHFNRARH